MSGERNLPHFVPHLSYQDKNTFDLYLVYQKIDSKINLENVILQRGFIIKKTRIRGEIWVFNFETTILAFEINSSF